MEKTVNSDLHLGQYWRIDIVCDPELRDEVEQYFSLHDVGFSKIEVFPSKIHINLLCSLISRRRVWRLQKPLWDS